MRIESLEDARKCCNYPLTLHPLTRALMLSFLGPEGERLWQHSKVKWDLDLESMSPFTTPFVAIKELCVCQKWKHILLWCLLAAAASHKRCDNNWSTRHSPEKCELVQPLKFNFDIICVASKAKLSPTNQTVWK